MKNDLILAPQQEKDGLRESQQQPAEEKKTKLAEALAAASGTWLSKTVKVSRGSSRALRRLVWCLLSAVVWSQPRVRCPAAAEQEAQPSGWAGSVPGGVGVGSVPGVWLCGAWAELSTGHPEAKQELSLGATVGGRRMAACHGCRCPGAAPVPPLC